MFRDTYILLDNTYTHVNNGSQTCSSLDHIAMSDVLFESTVDCHTLQDVACSGHCAITVVLNFDQQPITHTIERHKNKQVNCKSEMLDYNVDSIRGWIECKMRHPGDYCRSTGDVGTFKI